MLAVLALSMVVSVSAIFILKLFAEQLGLVDLPDSRKQHNQPIPQVGGLAILSSLIAVVLVFPFVYTSHWLLVVSLFSISLLGALDDKFNLDYRLRLSVVSFLALIMIVSGVELKSFGDIVGIGSLSLGVFSAVITICAVLGNVNAFNMIDGIDGLLLSMSLVSLTCLTFVFYSHGSKEHALMCAVLLASLIPCLMANVGMLGTSAKIFMGDSGSMFLGMFIIWMLISASGDNIAAMRPSTALWLIAVPLMDMTAVIISRCLSKKLPFTAGRDHIHHILLQRGMTKTTTLILLTFVAITFALVGLSFEFFDISETLSFSLFVGLFLIYFVTMRASLVVQNLVKSLNS
ncbi:undecaprenyl-phosphate alpha-N-acetylglucosaminyl 1-phosphate transferase [Veronia nyctiphanis]|uniref:Undecaprenyl-phosphate alpha-N-acetylglucosaminyl 1-phosphate transferase n=1 Tax=Veronia nyctiphanis TaxID=1278244 RepID=A0A4Q0YPS0_9GAMM|nr:undecaprenyl-phosphate alpha-N-acetylglucosaminyl 1-phosphate transferase [Veronia nyctiphanis]RXJ72982.1 undecaprenyl-phosphate alpha-N-acetylglucosaminyl 1-phosphate transferase [Veronia nyctiphanis]